MEMLAASGIVFWGLIAAFVIAMFYSVEYEKGFSATFTMIVAAVAAWALYDFNVVTFALANVKQVLVGIAVYLVSGTVWSVAKWWFFLISAKNYLLHDSDVRFKDILGKKVFYFRGEWQDVPPKFTKNKARFMLWLAYWPVSLVWTMLNDPVKIAFDWIYNTLGSSMQKMSDSVFKGIDVKVK